VALEDEFPGKLEIVSMRDPGTTGNFNVFINGQLVHSKKERGQGKCESQAEVDAIISHINKLLEN